MCVCVRVFTGEGYGPGLLAYVEPSKQLSGDDDQHLDQHGEDGRGTDEAEGGRMPHQHWVRRRAPDCNKATLPPCSQH